MPSLNYTHLTDSELLDLIKSQDDQQAFREIYRRYGKAVLGVAYKKVSSRETAEELTQNLFVTLWERRKEINIQHLSSYLFGSLKYSIINYYKSQMVQEKYIRYVQGNQDQVSYETEELVMFTDLTQAIEKGMAMLPLKTRNVFTLSRLEHFSVKEIASVLNLSEKAVEYHITQSLKLIRGYLKDYILLLLAFLFN